MYVSRAVFELVEAKIYLSQDGETFESTERIIDMFEFKNIEPIQNLRWNDVSQFTLESWYRKALEYDLLDYTEDGSPILILALRNEQYQSPYSLNRSWCMHMPTHVLPLKNTAFKLMNDYLRKYADGAGK